MRLLTIIFVFIIGLKNGLHSNSGFKSVYVAKDSILKVEMSLSAFGVESDHFPSIDVVIDFSKDTSICKKWYDNPAYKKFNYSLSKAEISIVYNLLNISQLDKLRKEYHTNLSDQPTSKTIIYTTKKVFIINDYGLKGDKPLQEMYKIVYKY